MKRVIIICEGPTEIEFLNGVLYPHLQSLDIYIETPLIKKSGGGIVSWTVLKKQVELHLMQDPLALVTTLIDYYGVLPKHLFPQWEESRAIVDRNLRMSFLEESMLNSIDQDLRWRFIPYIQLHEFEGLLFNNIETFTNNYPANEIKDLNELKNIIANYPNPELINDGKDTAPSKRLEQLLSGYKKKIYGATLAMYIGLDNVRAKSPRFNTWVTKLEGL